VTRRDVSDPALPNAVLDVIERFTVMSNARELTGGTATRRIAATLPIYGASRFRS